MLMTGVFLLSLAATQPVPVDALQKAAVTNDTWRTVEEYEYGQQRERLLYLYSAILYTKLREEEWKGISDFTNNHPDCDTLCVVGMVKREMEKK
jgi:hypothetical protein